MVNDMSTTVGDLGRFGVMDKSSATKTSQCHLFPNLARNGKCVFPPQYNSKPVQVATTDSTHSTVRRRRRIAHCCLSLSPCPHYVEVGYSEWMDPWLHSMELFEAEVYTILSRMRDDLDLDFHEALASTGIFDLYNVNWRSKMHVWAIHQNVLQFENHVTSVDSLYRSMKASSTMYGLPQPPVIFLQQIVKLSEMNSRILSKASELGVPHSRVNIVPPHRVPEALELAMKSTVGRMSEPDAAMLLSVYEDSDWPDWTTWAEISDRNSAYWQLIPKAELEKESHFEMLIKLWSIAAGIKLFLLDICDKNKNQPNQTVSTVCKDFATEGVTNCFRPQRQLVEEEPQSKRVKKQLNPANMASREEVVNVPFSKFQALTEQLRRREYWKILGDDSLTDVEAAAYLMTLEHCIQGTTSKKELRASAETFRKRTKCRLELD